ncbi:MAG: DEAD/DEAH box helicase [Coriobacteriia bacterium]|nr:DEAD/DEAH box helicase [Coriobacteriia bacterium]
MSFDNLGLEPRLMKAVASMGYTSATPIQLGAIPAVLEGRDVIGCAQTGTGKTAAFVLPTLQRVRARGRRPAALIVTPTRELAVQIEGVARQASRATGHVVAAIYGGVGYGPQAKALRKGVDVLVATPGRLLDLCNQGDCNLSHVEVLVLDEADRMLDMGFWPDVSRIISLLPSQRQNLLFSATMAPEVMRVVGAELTDPVRVDVAPPSTPIAAIHQVIYPVGSQQKMDLLVRLLQDGGLDRTLVFTRTKHRADRVAKVLANAGISGAAIHGNRTQAQRQQALDGFKRGRHRVLVATDIVARGIDVDNISHVINFDLPNVPEDYVHRIGRTARAGKSGIALSLFSPDELDCLRDIEHQINTVIACEDHAGFNYSDPRMVPDPDRLAAKQRGQQKRPVPGSGARKDRPGGGARRRRSAGSGMGSGQPGSSSK